MTPIDLTLLAPVVEATVAAGGYSAAWYARNKAQNSAIKWDPTKALATIATGAVIGAGLAVTGMDVNAGTVQARLIAYAGAVSVIEALIKSVRDAYKPRLTGREA